jgi:rRNA-processing protein EBP2
MARIKDRLLFENKKIEAVSSRKSNKEQKLRAKEAHNNKLMEKAKRKKDHFKAVEDWAASAESKRGKNNRAAGVDDETFLRNMNKSGGGGDDNNNNNSSGKKRKWADKKFGFGGKQGRFKKTDPSSLNDSSSFNRKGNFAQGMKKSPAGGGGAGGKRAGKRARDASRSRRN